MLTESGLTESIFGFCQEKNPQATGREGEATRSRASAEEARAEEPFQLLVRGQLGTLAVDGLGRRSAVGSNSNCHFLGSYAPSACLAASLDLKATKENAHNGWVMSVGYDKDGEKIVSGGSDGTIKVCWDAGEPFQLSPTWRFLASPHPLYVLHRHTRAQNGEDERAQ